jgi:hypothetical protein
MKTCLMVLVLLVRFSSFLEYIPCHTRCIKIFGTHVIMFKMIYHIEYTKSYINR